MIFKEVIRFPAGMRGRFFFKKIFCIFRRKTVNLFANHDIIQVKAIDCERAPMTKDGFEQLIQTHGNDIYRFCYHLTGCAEDADDLYQDTLCKAFEIRRRLRDPEDGETLKEERNYCLGIAIRLYKNLFRKKSRHIVESLDDEQKKFSEKLASGGKIDEKLAKQEMQAQVRNSIQALPLRQRSVIYLFYYSELSIKDIASLLHIPTGTVKSRLNKAKSALRKELEELRYE